MKMTKRKSLDDGNVNLYNLLDIKEIISQQYGISSLPKRTSEAMAYVPFQQFDSPTYSPLQGLESGTMFPVLNKPFYGKKCGEGLD